MNEAVLKEDDYEDWLKWVAHKEQQNMCQFKGSKDMKMPSMFQLGYVNNEQ